MIFKDSVNINVINHLSKEISVLSEGINAHGISHIDDVASKKLKENSDRLQKKLRECLNELKELHSEMIDWMQ